LSNRPSFDRKYIFAELDKLSLKITVPIRVFIIGGLALINYGLKEATKDIDVVVLTEADLEVLIKSLEIIGYNALKGSFVSRAYKKMEISKIVENDDGFRWDIFLRSICNRLSFSEDMESRATEFYSRNKLNLNIASKEDIFLFKGITEREADLIDMRLLAESSLEWQIIEKECINQSDKTGVLWEGALLQNLVELREKYSIRSPIEKTLRRVAEEKLGEDLIVDSISNGLKTIKSIALAKDLPYHVVRDYARKMEEKGIITFDKTHRPYMLSIGR
jgi:hypothetical protein